MKLDLDLLNRIGIILNFLAGFMLAPDLIGTKRISSFENYMESRIINLIEKIKLNLNHRYIIRNSSVVVRNFIAFTLLISGLFFMPISISEGYLLVLLQKTIGEPILILIVLMIGAMNIGGLLILCSPKT
ncbi:MAG: hypothetical protein ACLBM6_10965, partial [Cuspidothrix sp.]